MFCRQFIVCFLLEMATRLFLWGLLLHMAMAQVAVQHQAHLDQHHNDSKYQKYTKYHNNSRWNIFAHSTTASTIIQKQTYDQCSSADVQPTELHAEDQVSEKEAATSLAEPGSSRQEKCKRENVDRGTGIHFARKRLHKTRCRELFFMFQF